MKNLKHILFLIVLLAATLTSYGQISDSAKFKFSIEQTIQPGPNPSYIYEVKNHKIIVKKEFVIFGINSGIKTRKYSTSISELDYKAILTILESMNGKEYENSYSSYILDGISWKVKINYLNKKTEIYLHNTKLLEVEQIVELINSNLKRRRVISFDILEI